jgi:predicted CoA-binding protein
MEEILEKRSFAVAGVSREREKFGYKVYRALKTAGYTVYAINPNADTIDTDPCYPSLDNVPGPVD